MESEILRYRICDRTYNKETGRYDIVRVYHLYWNAQTKVINIKTPIKVEVLKRIKKQLAINNIEYTNIIIGQPDI